MDLLPGGNTSACKHWRLGKTGKPGPLWKFMAGAVVACVAIPWNSMQRKQVKPTRRWFGTWFVLKNKVVSLWTAPVQSCCTALQPYSSYSATCVSEVPTEVPLFFCILIELRLICQHSYGSFRGFHPRSHCGQESSRWATTLVLGVASWSVEVEINISMEAKAELPASTLAAQLIWPIERPDQRNYCSLGGWLLY